MNKAEFIKQLKATAESLKPLTESATPSALTWNGTEYVEHLGEAKSPNPYALAWRSMLTVVADLIEGQESPLSEMQLTYINRLFFGGMGSLNDLFFDPKELGEIANTINARLETQRQALYASFKRGGQ